MNYLLLLYGDEKAGANMSKEELDKRRCKTTTPTPRRYAAQASLVRARRCTRPRRPPRCACRVASASPPTGHSPRPKSSWAAST